MAMLGAAGSAVGVGCIMSVEMAAGGESVTGGRPGWLGVGSGGGDGKGVGEGVTSGGVGEGVASGGVGEGVTSEGVGEGVASGA